MTDLAPPDLAQRLQDGQVLHLAADVGHSRRGAIRHTFRHRVDFLLFSPQAARFPVLLRRGRFGLMSFHGPDHGGPRGDGSGPAWAWGQFAAAGLPPAPGLVLALLAQPRFLGHWFNPVSFWMVLRGDDLLAVIAEVNNTFGQRHSYLCACPLPDGTGFAPLGPDQTVRADKLFHVSPFQDVAGGYRFGFALQPDRLAIRIAQIAGDEGVLATMAGPLQPLTSRAVLAAALRRPGGSLRVVALIFWHALRLRLKGARYRPLPSPPEQEISR